MFNWSSHPVKHGVTADVITWPGSVLAISLSAAFGLVASPVRGEIEFGDCEDAGCDPQADEIGLWRRRREP